MRFARFARHRRAALVTRTAWTVLSLPVFWAVRPAQAQLSPQSGGIITSQPSQSPGGGIITQPPQSSGGGVNTINADGIPKLKSSYPLGPQDVLSITVERPSNYSVEQITIPPDGKISLPYFGTLKVVGKTSAQVDAMLTKAISKRVRNPQVSVTILRTRSGAIGYVSIIGSVRAPGQIEILDNYRITEVLTKVGGVTGRMDEVKASLARNGKQITLDLYKAVSYPRSPANVPVESGDFINIENVDPGRISLNGDVVRPGIYEMRRAPRPTYYEVPLTARLRDIVVAAGGFVGAKDLNAGRIVGTIQRGNQQIELQIREAIDLKDPKANVTLRAGDYVRIEVLPPIVVSVVGAARAPGNIALSPGAGVLQAIAATGYLARNPEEINASLQRGTATIPIALEQLLSGDSRANLPLQSGDIINLGEPANIRVRISGKVKKPSGDEALRLPPDATLVDALDAAGGNTVDNKEDVRISILRRMEDGTRRPLRIDALALLERDDESQNARLAQGDLITVSEARDKTVIVSGEVLKSGVLEWREGQGIAEIIAKAGGPTPRAALTRVNVLREGKTLQVDAYDSIEGGKPSTFALQENDTITVPRNYAGIIVTEAVRQPGFVSLPERRPLTVLEAITAAGGALPGARTQEVALLRKVGAKTVERRLPLKQLGKGNGKGSDVALEVASIIMQDGDVLVVPEGKVTQSALNTGIQALSLLSVARTFIN